MERKPLSVLSGALILAFVISPALAGELYKWKDKNGTTHFSDSPPESGTAKGLEAWSMPRDSGGQAEILTGIESWGSDAPAAAKAPSVILYTTSWCKYCRQAREFLASRGVAFEEHDVEREADALRRMKMLNPKGSVPTAVINDRVLMGFDQGVYSRALGNLR